MLHPEDFGGLGQDAVLAATYHTLWGRSRVGQNKSLHEAAARQGPAMGHQARLDASRVPGPAKPDRQRRARPVPRSAAGLQPLAYGADAARTGTLSGQASDPSRKSGVICGSNSMRVKKLPGRRHFGPQNAARSG